MICRSLPDLVDDLPVLKDERALAAQELAAAVGPCYTGAKPDAAAAARIISDSKIERARACDTFGTHVYTSRPSVVFVLRNGVPQLTPPSS